MQSLRPWQCAPGHLDEGISCLMEDLKYLFNKNHPEIMIQGFETLMLQAKPHFYGIRNTPFLPLLTAHGEKTPPGRGPAAFPGSGAPPARSAPSAAQE